MMRCTNELMSAMIAGKEMFWRLPLAEFPPPSDAVLACGSGGNSRGTRIPAGKYLLQHSCLTLRKITAKLAATLTAQPLTAKRRRTYGLRVQLPGAGVARCGGTAAEKPDGNRALPC